MGLPVVTELLNVVGSARTVMIGSLLNVCLFPLAGVTWLGAYFLAFGVMGIGFSMAIVDVSMNAHAVCLEKLYQKKVLGMFQSVNSFGSLIGVLVGGAFSAYGISPFGNFSTLAICFCPVSILSFISLIHVDVERRVVSVTRTFTNSAYL